MCDVIERMRGMSAEVTRVSADGTSEYLVIEDFGSSSIVSEAGFSKKYFRIFSPVKPFKGRKLNAAYGDTFNPYKDTLMDYPTIAQHRLGKVGSSGWENYNRLISLHVARCPLDCWHCYVEHCLRSKCETCELSATCDHATKDSKGVVQGYLSPKTIVEDFVAQREIDGKNHLSSNILRITGGEPFLAPTLLVEVLEEVKRRKLESEVLVWTETNLIPLVPYQDQAGISDELLRTLASHRNFCVHPCFHGITGPNLEENTGKRLTEFGLLPKALGRLVDAGIDVYPTFGSNTSSFDDVAAFFEDMYRIDRLLPLRFCLIEYDLDYKPIKWREEGIDGFSSKHGRVYNRYQVIGTWDALLSDRLGYRYADIPRHLVPIGKGR